MRKPDIIPSRVVFSGAFVVGWLPSIEESLENGYLAVLREDIDKPANFHKMVRSYLEFPLLSRKINEVEVALLPQALVLCKLSSGYDLVFIYIVIF